jgi:hypothetical protein
LDLVACLQVTVLTQEHHADFLFVEIEGNAEDPSREHQQLLVAHVGQTANPRDAGGDTDDLADFAHGHRRLEGFPCLL